jgi:simple sugar transport system ATP-binding protein
VLGLGHVGLTISFTHAYFEAVSGLTTTGATVLTGLDALPVSINVWRTWGVDVGAAAQIRGAILQLRDEGCAVLVLSEELDELFEICDRLHVVAKGRLSPSVARADATVQQIGEWMSGLWDGATPAPAARGGAHVQA